MLNFSVVSRFLGFVIVIISGADYKFLKFFLLYFKITCLCQWTRGRKICECPQIPSSISFCLLCEFSNTSRCSENKSWWSFDVIYNHERRGWFGASTFWVWM